MVSRMNNQSGFSIVEAVLIVAVIGVIGVGGWFVYQHNKPKATNAAPNTNQTTNQQTTTTTPAPTVNYLDIKEWGVKLPLSDIIKDAYYVILADTSSNADGKPSDIQLGLTHLDASCGSITASSTSLSNSLGAIVRTLPTDTDPVSGKLYTQLEPNGTTINGYYYGYADASIKNKTCAPQATLQGIDAAFATAAKGIIPAN